MTSSPSPAPAPAPGDIEIRVAWKRDDPAIEADAIAFWNRIGVLPQGVTPEARAKELIAAAYRDGTMIAVATASIEYVDFLHARFAVLRGATDPAHRRGRAQLALAVPSRRILERWALDHPEEKLAGGIAVVDAAEWGEFARLPVWPESELALIGYAEDGRQIRAAWFDHFRFD